jgi:hypothetical protein
VPEEVYVCSGSENVESKLKQAFVWGRVRIAMERAGEVLFGEWEQIGETEGEKVMFMKEDERGFRAGSVDMSIWKSEEEWAVVRANNVKRRYWECIIVMSVCCGTRRLLEDVECV